MYDLSGRGSPEGVVTARVGTRYRDVTATAGAVSWVKASGAGATGWAVEYGETGWRDITASATGLAASNTGKVWLRRRGHVCELRFDALALADGTGSAFILANGLPAGFTYGNAVYDGTEYVIGQSSRREVIFVQQNDVFWIATHSGQGARTTTRAGAVVGGKILWATDDAWPASLPGTA